MGATQPPLDVPHVQQRVQHIATMATDYEATHGMEDELHQDVLRHVADHSTDALARALASAALATVALGFGRYCA